jgi:hypothetical protein
MSSKYLTSQEYNSIVTTIVGSSNYITSLEKKKFDLIFDKLFKITEDDFLKKEEINKPITNS